MEFSCIFVSILPEIHNSYLSIELHTMYSECVGTPKCFMIKINSAKSTGLFICRRSTTFSWITINFQKKFMFVVSIQSNQLSFRFFMEKNSFLNLKLCSSFTIKSANEFIIFIRIQLNWFKPLWLRFENRRICVRTSTAELKCRNTTAAPVCFEMDWKRKNNQHQNEKY